MTDEEVKAGVNPGGTGASGRWRPLVLVAILAVAVITGRALGLGERLGMLRGWIVGLGPWGGAVFALLYAAGTVLALPGSAMAVAAAALFGSLRGFFVVNIGATLGLGLAFLVSRYAARGMVERMLGGSEKFRRLDRLTGEHGAAMVAVTRLLPIFPFNLLNYGFGLTRVPFGTYLFWSWLCIIPGDLLYIVGTDAVVEGMRRGGIPWVLVSVLAVVAAVLVLLVRSIRRTWGRRLDDPLTRPGPEGPP